MENPKYDPAKIALLVLRHKGNLSQVARSLKCSRQTIHNYANEYPEIETAIHDAREAITDLAESKLVSAITRGDAWAVCFYLKTQGKSRGYIERQEITGADGESLRPIIYLPAVIENP